ncbi:electron transfer flavoprotein alpha/beta subunit [Peptoniphilus stercorisuis]|uniref:Electron transfer flavoprotein alpha/beta subunit n=2 Tax=Peptoniphilus stercorisuis TaxID=1436965 RepID=A0ABS4KE12_9FIRM|nr:electron transfer flavoprotein alpha/beta subunit [Peptoniphilus stercorisuis]
MALSIKDQLKDTNIIALSRSNDELLIREAYSIGVDQGILFKDESYTKETLIEKIKEFEPSILITGKDNLEIQEDISKKLNLPLINNVENINIKDNKLEVKCETNNELLNFPISVNIINKDIKIRYSSIGEIFKSYDKDLLVI